MQLLQTSQLQDTARQLFSQVCADVQHLQTYAGRTEGGWFEICVGGQAPSGMWGQHCTLQGGDNPLKQCGQSLSAPDSAAEPDTAAAGSHGAVTAMQTPPLPHPTKHQP